jgi:glucan 1,3-beta-glucosidase
VALKLSSLIPCPCSYAGNGSWIRPDPWLCFFPVSVCCLFFVPESLTTAATSISNVFFKSGIGSQSQGLWMDDGSGGHLQDITFEGGIYGMWVGNQQFTSRNITIRNTSRAAIYLNWDWAWTFKEVYISDSPIGVDVNGGNDPRPQGTGSIVILDSTFSNVGVCVRTGFKAAASPVNTLILDNVDISGPAGTLTIVQNLGVSALSLPGPTAHVPSYIQGQVRAGAWERHSVCVCVCVCVCA